MDPYNKFIEGSGVANAMPEPIESVKRWSDMKDTYILIFRNCKSGESFDIEVPKYITANELIISLNKGLRLGIDMEDTANCFLRAENPIALIKGDTVLEEYQLHDGSILWYGGTKE